MGVRYAHTASVLLLIAISFGLHLSLVKFPEPDAFYHFRHAAIYVEKGPFYQEFPWHTQSVIGERGADIWYGFHILLIPFTFIPDPLLSLRIASASVLLFLLLCIYWAARTERWPMPILWPILALGCAPGETWRWLALRPFVISLGLAVVLFVQALRGQRLAVALLSFAIAWVHPAFFWVGPLITVGVFAFRGFFEKKWDAVSPLLGIVCAGVGLIARPDAIDALWVLKVQIIDLNEALKNRLPLTFGLELYPLSMFRRILMNFIPYQILWFGAVAAGIAIAKRQGNKVSPHVKAGFAVSLLISVLFGLMTVFQSQRGSEMWTLFGTISMAYAAGMVWSAPNPAKSSAPTRAKSIFSASVASASALLVAYSITLCHLSINAAGKGVYTFANAMQWLKQNSRPGDIVYQTNWAFFPEMFFWNTKNRYITGMDPIFMYAHNPDLCWKFTRILVDRATNKVTGVPPGELAHDEDTYEVLKDQFQAKYVLVSATFNPKFLQYLLSDKRYELVFDENFIAIFLIRPAPPAPTNPGAPE